jgi:hypothetical protein
MPINSTGSCQAGHSSPLVGISDLRGARSALPPLWQYGRRIAAIGGLNTKEASRLSADYRNQLLLGTPLPVHQTPCLKLFSLTIYLY